MNPGFATFLAVAIGFGLIGFGVSPLIRHDPMAARAETDLGCALVIVGVAIIVITTAVKVLS